MKLCETENFSIFAKKSLKSSPRTPFSFPKYMGGLFSNTLSERMMPFPHAPEADTRSVKIEYSVSKRTQPRRCSRRHDRQRRERPLERCLRRMATSTARSRRKNAVSQGKREILRDWSGQLRCLSPPSVGIAGFARIRLLIPRAGVEPRDGHAVPNAARHATLTVIMERMQSL